MKLKMLGQCIDRTQSSTTAMLYKFKEGPDCIPHMSNKKYTITMIATLRDSRGTEEAVFVSNHGQCMNGQVRALAWTRRKYGASYRI